MMALFAPEWLEAVATWERPARVYHRARGHRGHLVFVGCLFTDEVMRGDIVAAIAVVDALEATPESAMPVEQAKTSRFTGIDGMRRTERIARDKGRIVAIVVNTAYTNWLGHNALRVAGYGTEQDWYTQDLASLRSFLEEPPLCRRVEVRHGATPENLAWAEAVDVEYSRETGEGRRVKRERSDDTARGSDKASRRGGKAASRKRRDARDDDARAGEVHGDGVRTSGVARLCRRLARASG